MILSLIEAKTALGSSAKCDDDVVAVAAGFSNALRRACNRIFADRVEKVDVDGGTATVTVYRHGLNPGDKVRLATDSRSSDIDAQFTTLETGFTRDQFQITTDITQEAVDALDNITMRRVWSAIQRTKEKTASLFVDWRPLVEVVSLSLPDGNDGWTAIDATDYSIADTLNGISLSGEIVLLDRTFPRGINGSKFHPAGCKVEYLAGEPEAPPEIVWAIKGLLGQVSKRTAEAAYQSETYEYHSYSRMSPRDIGRLFGEADRVINEFRIHL